MKWFICDNFTERELNVIELAITETDYNNVCIFNDNRISESLLFSDKLKIREDLIKNKLDLEVIVWKYNEHIDTVANVNCSIVIVYDTDEEYHNILFKFNDFKNHLLLLKKGFTSTEFSSIILETLPVSKNANI